jgi:hypothetical protein
VVVGFLEADLTADDDIEVGSGQFQQAVRDFEQHVREDRQGGAAADHALHLREAFHELFFADAELHTGIV